jgi:hypothetical protein
MLSWLTTILGFFTGLGGPISAVVKSLQTARLAEKAAETYIEKKKIDLEIEEIQSRKAVLVAEAGSRLGLLLNGSIRIFIAIGPAAYLTKIFLWDKVVASFIGCAGVNHISCKTFVTDSIDPNLWWVVFAVISFYFMYDIASKFMRK